MTRTNVPFSLPALLAAAFGLGCLAFAAAPARAQAPVVVGTFSAGRAGGAMPEGWRPLQFQDGLRPTTYALVVDGGAVVMKATSARSASGLTRQLTADTRTTPMLSWRWKVPATIPGLNERQKNGDDYAARIYVTFAYNPSRLSAGDRLKYRALRILGYRDIPVRALNYVWAGGQPQGATYWNPFTNWVRMVVVQSGASRAGTWVAETRDVAADYRAAFGEDAPPISGIAIMTDSDNSKKQAEAYYGDLTLTGRGR